VLALSVPALRAGIAPAGEFCFLLASSMTGGVVIGYAGDLITLIVGLETLTLPLYVLVGLRRFAPGERVDHGRRLRRGHVLPGQRDLHGDRPARRGAATRHRRAAPGRCSPAPGRCAPLAAVGAALLVIGFAFKVAAVPLHAGRRPPTTGRRCRWRRTVHGVEAGRRGGAGRGGAAAGHRAAGSGCWPC
jgi:NADH-quinone oxidoreductase subunit N